MDDLFNSIGLISAIIGGFSFTFVGALLSTSSKSSLFNWVYALAMIASISLMATALGAVLTALAAEQNYNIDLSWMHQKISLLFLLGIIALLLSISFSGFVRSHQLGYVSLGVGSLGLTIIGWVLLPYLIIS